MKFRDFVPKRFAGAGGVKFLGFTVPVDQFESFDDCVAAAGEWVEKADVDVINVETVVLPNMYNPGEQGSTDPELDVSDSWTSRWFQFVRVWYR